MPPLHADASIHQWAVNAPCPPAHGCMLPTISVQYRQHTSLHVDACFQPSVGKNDSECMPPAISVQYRHRTPLHVDACFQPAGAVEAEKYK